MQKVLIAILCLFINISFAQKAIKKSINSQVSEVTVFLKGAQVTRLKTVDIKTGKTILKFVNLSPYIDAKSIQIKTDNAVTVLSVNHNQDFLNKLKKSEELKNLEKKLNTLKDKIELENTYLDIIKEELTFLKANRNIGGKNQTLNVTTLKEASNFYSSKLTALKLKEIERYKTLAKLRKVKNDISNQIATITNKKEFPTGEILIKIDAKKNLKASFKISYLVNNAGWYPSYDVRAKNINQPLELVYKANVRQDTKVDWTNVKLKFSSTSPDISGVAPKLKSYYLNYNTLPPVYGSFNNTVTGVVSDNSGPLPGVNVMVKGTTIGTQTDFDGRYTLTVPDNNSRLEFSFVGMETATVIANRPQINLVMNSDSNDLDEVVVTAQGVKRDRKALGYGVSRVLSGKASGIQIRGASSIRGSSHKKKERNLANQIKQVRKQTTVEFEIKTPHTLKSSNKNYVVAMKGYKIDAGYQYYSVPKIKPTAFLIANITHWEKYNLLDGEINIFFEETYMGKSLLDLREATDTLQISLGNDKQVSVKREKVKAFTTRQFIGNKKAESKAWKITVRNNKKQQINMVVYDQAPVSTLEEIKIEIDKNNGAQFNSKTGEMKWLFSLASNSKKELNLKYTVKYPKYRKLIIE
jgi:Domain of unknown function (DUF4139)/N-terminal domain of unknown function (DUF4140)